MASLWGWSGGGVAKRWVSDGKEQVDADDEKLDQQLRVG